LRSPALLTCVRQRALFLLRNFPTLIRRVFLNSVLQCSFASPGVLSLSIGPDRFQLHLRKFPRLEASVAEPARQILVHRHDGAVRRDLGLGHSGPAWIWAPQACSRLGGQRLRKRLGSVYPVASQLVRSITLTGYVGIRADTIIAHLHTITDTGLQDIWLEIRPTSCASRQPCVQLRPQEAQSLLESARLMHQ